MIQPVFPIALRLVGRACLVVGSSAELTLRTRGLLDAGARPVVVSTAPNDEIRMLASTGQIELYERDFIDADLDGKWLAVLVDENRGLAARIGALAEASRVFFCAIDQPEHNTFAHMAQARAGLLTVAISTSGQAPSFGRRLREELERMFAASKVADFVDRLAALRAQTASPDRRRVLGAAVSTVRFTGELNLD